MNKIKYYDGADFFISGPLDIIYLKQRYKFNEALRLTLCGIYLLMIIPSAVYILSIVNNILNLVPLNTGALVLPFVLFLVIFCLLLPQLLFKLLIQKKIVTLR